MAALGSRQPELSAILVTYHHADRIGLSELRGARKEAAVFELEDSGVPADVRVSEGMRVDLGGLGLGCLM